MPDTYIQLAGWQVAAAAALIVLNAAISIALRLELERRLLIASVRAIVQLLLIGLVLGWVFELRSAPVVAGLLGVMTVIAGVAAVGRSSYRYRGDWLNSIVSVWVSSWVVTALALGALLAGERPWYEPQYAIPLLGMILGNTLTGVSLGLDRLGSELSERRDQVEALLTLGATRWEAALPAIRAAVRTGMIPLVNSMMVVGIVSLPGMMTGQLLAGVHPWEAVKYQLVILFLIAAATALGTLGVVLLSYRQLFNRRHQFLHERIHHNE